MRTIIISDPNTSDLFKSAINNCPWSNSIEDIILLDETPTENLAATWANQTKRTVTRLHEAKWKKYGKSAGPRRHRDACDLAHAVLVIRDPDKAEPSAKVRSLLKEAARVDLEIWTYEPALVGAGA